jgi:FkbM family methyltransferase
MKAVDLSSWDRMLDLAQTKGWSRFLGRVAGKAGRIAASRFSSFTRLGIGPYEVRLPGSHTLPFCARLYPSYSLNLGRLAVALGPQPRVIDIGANVGDSAAILLAHIPCEILCIEGNQAFLPFLRENIDLNHWASVTVEGSWVFTGQGAGTLSVLTSRGTARLVQGGTGALQGKTLEQIVQGHPSFKAPDLLKIDTDGYDGAIILANLESIQGWASVIFFEYDPYFWARGGGGLDGFFSKLEAAGYAWALVWDNFGAFIGSVDLADAALVRDLELAWTGHQGRRYADIAVFPRSRERQMRACADEERQFQRGFSAYPGRNFSYAIELGKKK